MSQLICSALLGLAVLSCIQMEQVFASANFSNENSVPALTALHDKELGDSRKALAAEYEPTIVDAEKIALTAYEPVLKLSRAGKKDQARKA